MKVLEKMHRNLQHYINSMHTSFRDKRKVYDISQMYRGTIATDCMFIVTESMKVAIGHVEKNETIREAYLLFRSDVTKSFDLLEEFIKLNGFKDVDAIRNRVKRYEHEYRYYIKVIIEAVKVHYEEQKKDNTRSIS